MSSAFRFLPVLRKRTRPLQFVLMLAVAVCCSAPALAVKMPQQGKTAIRLLSAPAPMAGLDVQPDVRPQQPMQLAADSNPAAAAFLATYGGTWQIRMDQRSGHPNLVQGSGIALIPGRGNHLAGSASAMSLQTVAGRALDFIHDNAQLLGTAKVDLRLDPDSSIPYGDGSSHWFLQFDQYVNDIPVRGARVFVRISQGNVIQFGNIRVVPASLNTKPALGRKQAYKAMMSALQFMPNSQVAEGIHDGNLVVLPFASDQQAPGLRFSGEPGSGYEHVLARHYTFRVKHDPATYDVMVDANTGRVLEVRNLTVHAQAEVSGEVYVTDHVNRQLVSFPFTAVNNGSTKVTDVDGHYDYAGGTATVALDGKYFSIVDNCGAISLSNNTDGNLALGGNSGTDCSTPGFGGAGNTNASRSAFYNLTLINAKGRTYYPTNSWLQGKVTAEVNVNQTCNASWDGTQLNFYKSGEGCANTGEIPGVFLHEWGHGMDANSGGPAGENGSGEAVGDTFAFLEMKESCVGDGFFTDGSTCYNCNTGCTGVRDVRAFSLDGPAGNAIASPATITADNGVDADRATCPYYQYGIFPYQGPMGYEGHLESYIASSANWDLAQALVNEYGQSQGWQEMNRIWYGSLTSSQSAYQVESGGQCNINATVNGCGAENWYTVYLAADDDDGDLSNGTPNACRIWDAFDAHGIACGVRPVCTSGGAPAMDLAIDPVSGGVCSAGTTSYTISTSALGNPPLSSPITLAVSGLPTGVTAGFSTNPVTPGSDTTLTLTVDAAASSGATSFVVTGTASGADDDSVTGELQIADGIPTAAVLAGPADGATDVPYEATLSWQASIGATSYTLDVATDAAFSNIVITQAGLTATSTNVSLSPGTTYYWRVTPTGPCGDGAVSSASFTTVAAPFPAPYCDATFPSNVEPISRVLFANIDNSSSPALNGTPALEDFTSIVASVQPGQTLPIAVEGNTDGDWTDTVYVYVDWNRDGDFTGSGEEFALSSLTNSTGSDGKQSTGDIVVPANATGETRMRVVKRWNANTGPCSTSGYGQAEDYTVAITTATTHVVTPAVTAGNGSIAPATPQTVADGTSIAFTLTPDVGFHIDSAGGTCGGTLTGNVFTTNPVTADCTVEATFAVDMYTVTAISAGNGSITPPSQTVSAGGTASFTVMPDPGYHVLGVTGDTCTVTGSASSWIAADIQADCVVTASFDVDQFTLAYTAGNHGSLSGAATQTVDYGQSGTPVTAVADPGYHFAQWSDGLTANPRTDSNVQADVAVTAQFDSNVLVFTAQPADVLQGESLGSVTVQQQDGAGNLVGNDNSSTLVLSVDLACGETVDLGTVTFSGGVATLDSDVPFYTLASGYTLQAQSSGALSATASSAAFDVVANSGLLFSDGFESCRP